MMSREFGILVNMSSEELEDWLKSEGSTSSGWNKDDGSGETIGHDRYVSCAECSNILSYLWA